MATLRDVYPLQDRFHASTDPQEREQIRREIHDLGFVGIAASIGYPAEEQAARARRAAADERR